MSRSESVSDVPDLSSPEGGEQKKTPRPRRDDVEFNELNIQLRISYKTLVLAFVLFDVLHKGINVLVDTEFVQSVL